MCIRTSNPFEASFHPCPFAHDYHTQRRTLDEADHFSPQQKRHCCRPGIAHCVYLFQYDLSRLGIEQKDDHREDKVQYEDHLRELVIGTVWTIVILKIQLLALGSAVQ